MRFESVSPAALLLLISSVFQPVVWGKVYFKETFEGGIILLNFSLFKMHTRTHEKVDAVPKRWIQSQAKTDYGKFKVIILSFFSKKKI